MGKDNQVGGFITAYEGNFTFATVRGSGHMVPEDKPMEAYYLLSRWLDGKPLAYKH